MGRDETTTLYRPVGLGEFEKIRDSGMREFPPRLEGQPIFYPVTNRSYAEEIAGRWNVRDERSGHVGIVTRFEVDAEYAGRFDRRVVGAQDHEELWVPAERLDEFNDRIDGEIEVVEVFYGEDYDGPEIREAEDERGET